MTSKEILRRSLPELSDNDLKFILNLKYRNGENIISEEDPFNTLEIINLWLNFGKDFFSGEEYENSENFIWDSPLMYESKKVFYTFLHSQTIEREGIKGLTTCKNCKNDVVVQYSKQTRSGDEGTTIFNRCLRCNHNWVEH